MNFFTELLNNFTAFPGDLPNAVSMGLVFGMMTLGVYLTFRILNIADMTCDGSFVLGGAICVVLVIKQWDPLIALVASFGLGTLAGLVTGILHTKFKMHELLAGILTMTGLYSINLMVLTLGKPESRNRISNLAMDSKFMDTHHTIMDKVQSVFPVSPDVSAIIVGVLIAIVVVALLYWFCGTEIGSALRATGNNPNMVRAMGVDTDLMKILGLMISNGLIALSGGMYAQAGRVADVTMGTGTLVQGLAAIVIGEAVFGFLEKKLPFWFTLMSVILGTIIYKIVIAFVIRIGIPTEDMKLFTSLIIAVALAVPVIKGEIKKFNMRRGNM